MIKKGYKAASALSSLPMEKKLLEYGKKLKEDVKIKK